MNKIVNLSNDELLILLRSGDRDAFTEIYNRHWKTLYAMAYARIKDTDQAEDILQDIFSFLWSNREKTEIQNLNAYLGTAVKFRVLACIRKESYKSLYNNQFAASEEVDSYNVIDGLHYRSILQAINEEVEHLPEKCKLVFKYSREHNMSVKEISSEMEISTSTVENHLNKALKRLHVVVRNLTAGIFSLLISLLS